MTWTDILALALAEFRSVEIRLEMVRSANTGVPAHNDAAGRVKAILPSVDPSDDPPPALMLVEAALLDRGCVYAHIGDAFACACLLALGALVMGVPLRGRPAGRERRPRRHPGQGAVAESGPSASLFDRARKMGKDVELGLS